MTPAQMRNKARAIREDVAWNTKWGTNFPRHTIQEPLEKARELEQAACRIESSSQEKP